jgi:hypothetical protein
MKKISFKRVFSSFMLKIKERERGEREGERGRER